MKKRTVTHTPFEPGHLVMTRAVPQEFTAREVFTSVMRHLQCDWGDVPEADWVENDKAVRCGDRLVSAYRFGDKRLLVMTKTDRSATTVMLPEDY